MLEHSQGPPTGSHQTTHGPALSAESLHARYKRRIDRHVRAVLGPDTEHEDLVQEVLLTVFRKVGTLRNPLCLDRWVNQITANTLKYVMRQRRLRRHASLAVLSEHQIPTVYVNVEARELASRAMQVMERLPRSDRALLASYWFSSATAVSIAAESGCSVITVRRRLFRARNRFEKLARRDPTLARCIDDARARSRRWGYSPCEDDNGDADDVMWGGERGGTLETESGAASAAGSEAVPISDESWQSLGSRSAAE